MNSPLWAPLFQALIRIEKKLDEVMRTQQANKDPNNSPAFHLTQPLNHPGQHPCGLCGTMPQYRKVNMPNPSGTVDIITMRFCECKPHTEDT